MRFSGQSTLLECTKPWAPSPAMHQPRSSESSQRLEASQGSPAMPLQEQASWVCQCEESLVQRLEHDFKVTLQQQSSLDQWASWLDNVVTQVLKQHSGSPSFPKAARQFLLKWSFYR